MQYAQIRNIAIAAALASTGFACLAVDGTVTVNGTISAQTCTIKLNGGSSSGTVTLPKVTKAALGTSAGTVAGATGFTIGVSGCSTTSGTMNTFFEPHSGSTNGSGRISNSDGSVGGAVGVEVQILQGGYGDLVVVDMTKNAGSQGHAPITLSGGAATQSFMARYYTVMSAPQPGAFSGSFNYSIVYN